MAIGDFWDSSYNPSYEYGLFNARTGKSQWLPDMSDEVRQKEVGTIQSRNRGRFCSEGCGCVNTYCDSGILVEGQYGCHLPPELAITIVKNTEGRLSAKTDIEGGGGETIHLKYSKGSWRGRRCCTHNAYGELNYACDPCKVTTAPNGKPSECHPANNKYKNFDDNFPDKQVSDDFTIRNDFDYDAALRGESNWPRIGENAWLKLSVYNTTAPTTGTDFLKGSPPTAGFAALCFDASGLPVEGISDEEDCEINDGHHWSPSTPVQFNHGIDDEYPDDGGHLQLVGTNEHQTKFSLAVKTDEVITNIKSRERIIKISEDGFLSGYTINNGADPDETRGPGTLTYSDPKAKDSGCLEDGSTPLKKRPYCRNPITGKREQQKCEEVTAFEPAFESSAFSKTTEQKECEATKSSINGSCSIGDPVTQEAYTDEASCQFAGGEWTWDNNKWLKNDKVTCEILGSCLKPEESKKQSQEERIIEPYCLDIGSGTKDPVPQNKAECEEGGIGIWKLEDSDSCEASYKSGPAVCNDLTGKESGHADKESCEVAGNIWMQNEWVSNQWVDWEYEKLSCCGQVIIDETYPSRVPQVSGPTLNARKNATCTTPYHEVILSPYQAAATVQDSQHGCLAAINQHQRDDSPDTEFFFDTRSYWTLLIRPCNFVGGCFDENVKRPAPADLTGTPSENYYDTTCGEEIVLYLTTDQLVNCSNLNLTLESEAQIRSGWIESEPMWDKSIGDKLGNPAKLQFLMPGAEHSMVYGGSSEYSFPGDAMYKNQYAYWCADPDVNVDGYGDKKDCKKWHYWNSGAEKFQLDNPKGVDAFYAFNLQPQPFKATEEKQNRAKTLYHAAIDHRSWETCVGHLIPSGGHWFWNYGPDYFMYYDFTGYDEVSLGVGNSIGLKEGGKCTALAKAAKDYVDNTVGFLRRGDCGYGNGAMWVGWIPDYDAWVNNKLCGDCLPKSEGQCVGSGSCQQQDGSFIPDQKEEDNCDGIGQCLTPVGTVASYGSENDCENNGGTWVPAKFVSCCEWISGCSEKVLTNYEGVMEGEEPVYRDAVDQAECERSPDDDPPGAGGDWTGDCIPTEGQREEDQSCGKVQNPPEDLVDLVLGEQVGTCVLHKDVTASPFTSALDSGFFRGVEPPVNANITDMTKKECGEESIKMHCAMFGVPVPGITTQSACAAFSIFAEWETVYSEDPPPKFQPDMVGHYDSKYPRRENSVVKLRKAGPLTSDFADTSSIQEGFKTISGRLPAGDELENSLNYWHQTGLYPKPEIASHVSDGCVGISHEGRIEHASNTTPIKITSRSHGLSNGDLLMIQDVLGNFAANVWLTQRDVKETQWEDKLYSECVGKNCEDQTYPTSECLYIKDEDGNEVCPDEYLECYGMASPGNTKPQYAPFAVVKNATADTFDLYTCDGLPLIGDLTEDAIANLPEEVDSHGTPIDCEISDTKVCWWSYGNPMTEGYFGGVMNPINPPPLSIVTEVVEDGAVNNGKPTIGQWAARCLAYDTGQVVNQPADARSDYKFNSSVVTGAAISENYTCGGTIAEGGDWCGEADCDVRLGTWQTKQDMADNALTEKVEGSKQACESYGLCNVIKDAGFKVTRSLTTQSDCIKLARVWHTYDLDAHFDSKSQIYVERCQDADGNIDNSERIQNAPNIKEACEKIHPQGSYIKQPSNCVEDAYDEKDDNAYKPCWEANVFSIEMATGMNTNAMGNERVLPNYPVCPYTGTWNVFHKDAGVEAGYFNESDWDSLYKFGWGGLSRRWEERANDYYIQIEQKGICPVCCDHFMPKNLTATLYDTDSDLQDIIGGCEMDPCEAKDYVHNSGKNVSRSNEWGYTSNNFTSIYDGYCCTDFYHPCDFGMNDIDLWECYADPTQYGRCERNVTTRANLIVGDSKTKDDCQKKGAKIDGGTKFYPLADGLCKFTDGFVDESGGNVPQPPDTNKNQANCEKYYCSFDMIDNEADCIADGKKWMKGTWLEKNVEEVKDTCQNFLRQRITVNGVSNCRQCSKLYNDKDRVPLKDGFDNTGQQFDGSACCECLVNERDEFYESRYPSCEVAVTSLLPTCNAATLGMVRNLGEGGALKATCVYKLFDPDALSGEFYWSFDPCTCFPRNVPPKCEGDYIEVSPESSCERDGVVNAGDNRRGCRDSAHNLIDTKGTDSCKDANGDILPAIKDQNTCELFGHTWNTTEKDCDKAAGEYFIEGSSPVCRPIHITTDFDDSHYDYAKAAQHQYETCPGFGSLDVPLEYDGTVWRSEWKMMNDVGVKQCLMGQHKFTLPKNCQPKGQADSPPHEDYEFSSAGTLVAVNADCGNCDAAQYAYAGVRVDGIDWWNQLHREHEEPVLPKDGHFIRLVMGCGNSIPSITSSTGKTEQGGFGGNVPSYRDNGIGIYAQIANCNFYDAAASSGLEVGREISGTSGNPPCAGSTCISKEDLIDGDYSRKGKSRKYTFAGRCIQGHKDCGNSGPCADIGDCCTYTGADQALFAAPLYSGAVACTSGGDLRHRCSAWGYDPFPHKPAETFTVYYVKDINPATGEATLVVNTGFGCAYPEGAIISIGQAELMDAEYDDFGSTSRNNMPRNPFLPAGATHLLSSTISVFDAGKAIPEPYCSISRADGTVYTTKPECEFAGGDWIIPDYSDLLLFDPSKPLGEPDSEGNRIPRDIMDFRTEKIKKKGIPDGRGSFHTLFQQNRGNSPFMEIRVADITPLITKNPRQNRHLKIFDRTGVTRPDSVYTEVGPNMLADNEKAFPFGNNPWPVGVQNHSSAGNMWPKGVSMGHENTEHLRKDPTGTHTSLGRVGLLPDTLNLNMLSRYDETVDDTQSTAVPLIFPAETVMINSIDNVYATDEESGYCIGTTAFNKEQCEEWEDTEGNKTAVWIPDFLYTKVTTGNPHDVKDGEKIIISGSVTYQATCLGARLGYCHGDTGKDINECMRGICRDVQHPAGFGIAGGKLKRYDYNPELTCSDPTYTTEDTCQSAGKIWASHPWNNEFDCMQASQEKEQEMMDNGWDPDGEITKDLVFTPTGTWTQSYEDDEADKQICDAFGGDWIVGETNNETDKKGFYADPLNKSPLELTNKEKDFTEGCPVNCELNGFAVPDPCTSHYSEPPGNCYECLLLKVVEDGEEKEEARCPRAVHDGAYIARTNPKRYCQNISFNPDLTGLNPESNDAKQKTDRAKYACIQNGWDWYDDIPLNEKYDIALHSELNMDFVNGSKIWGDQRVPQRAIDKGRNVSTDWMLDPELREGYVEDNLANFKTGDNTKPSSAIKDRGACESYREHVWIDTTPLRPPSGFSSAPAGWCVVDGSFVGGSDSTPPILEPDCVAADFDGTKAVWTESGQTDHGFDSGFGNNDTAASSEIKPTGQCVYIRKIRQFMDSWSPQTGDGTSLGDDVDKFLEEDVDGNAAKIVSGLQEACSRSDNCTLRKDFGWCMNLDEQMQGICYEYNKDTSSWRETTSSGYCAGTALSPDNYKNKGDCEHAGGNWIWNNVYKDCSGIFIGEALDMGSNTLESKMTRAEACATKGMAAYGGASSSISSTAVIPDFVCADPQDPDYAPTYYCSISDPATGQPYTTEGECLYAMGDWIEVPPVKSPEGVGMTERVCREIALGYPIYKGHCNNSDARSKSECDEGMWQPAIDPAPEYPMSVMPTYTSNYECSFASQTYGTCSFSDGFVDADGNSTSAPSASTTEEGCVKSYCSFDMIDNEAHCVAAGEKWMQGTWTPGETPQEPPTNEGDCAWAGGDWIEVEPTKSNKGLDLLTSLSSPEAIAMGHETGIGIAPRNYKGVIYAANIEKRLSAGTYGDAPYCSIGNPDTQEPYTNEADCKEAGGEWVIPSNNGKTYTKYGVQENERAVWSRHGGSFDILVGYPPPENNCRDVNSDEPTNLDWYLKFPQICCNARGPLTYYECADNCWHSVQGPQITNLPLWYETDGLSQLRVNVHE